MEKVEVGLQHEEVLDYVERDFKQYAWSLRTLQRHLCYFGIKHVDKDVSIDQVQGAVRQELEGPGKLLGYRAMCQKVRQVHKLNVPRDLVYDVMFDLDPMGLKDRANKLKQIT
eukprot:Seg3293.1 transcript_id=Seg3293.1/GoldUCD/mRNA.D3Y31 product="hypothetical protein" protein_id=Seg3293.1/GoldUCD/D3Y31